MTSGEVQRGLTLLNVCDCAHLIEEPKETLKGRVSFPNHQLGVSEEGSWSSVLSPALSQNWNSASSHLLTFPLFTVPWLQ